MATLGVEKRLWSDLGANEIPGTAKVPVEEIISFFKGKTVGLLGLDIGSGSGRSSEILKKKTGSDIVALDLNIAGLKSTRVDKKTQARAEKLPFRPDAFDFVVVCGVMTNLVDRQPDKAKQLRLDVAKLLFKVVKPGGCVAVSDFGSERILDDYNVDYKRHFLITGEMGTIAVLRSGETFYGKSDDEIIALGKRHGVVERYAHHYTRQELSVLFTDVGFSIDSTQVGLVQTPRGKVCLDNIVQVARK